MESFRRVAIMGEMHGRDLTRRHAALGLLVALPLSFYLASIGSGDKAIVNGGVGLAFAVSGATLFSILSSSEVDQRLLIGGDRALELLLGRLAFLGPMGVTLAALFTALMSAVSEPTRPWLTFVGVAAVALMSIPVGLAIGAAVHRELEGTLLLIGIVGMQLALNADSIVSKLLPFHGPEELIRSSLVGHGPILWPIVETIVYGAALFVVARVLLSHRIEVTRHTRHHMSRESRDVRS